MRVAEVLILEGRNIYSHHPTARVTVELEDLCDKESREITHFNAHLLKTLPGLAEHSCSGRQGGFVARLQQGTYFGHIVEHVILELQTLLGYNKSFGKTRYAGKPGHYQIVFEYGLAPLVQPLVELAIQVVKGLLNEQSVVIDVLLEDLRRRKAEAELGPSTMAIVTAAKHRGISVRRLGHESLVQLGTGKHLRRVQATLGPHSSCIAADIACDKSMTKLLLSRAGIPVPFGLTVSNPKEAVEAWRLIGRPVAIKPSDGNQGKGVSLNLDSPAEVEAAFELALRFGSKVIVEEYIKGKHYRLLVVGDRLVAAAERIPAHVVGDGIHTIRELVTITNRDPLRGDKHEKPLTRMYLDDLSGTVLKKQGQNPESVPSEGLLVYLRDSANLSTGGTASDVTDDVHHNIRSLAVRVARIVGLDIAGIDMVLQDISEPLVLGSVIEVNAAPGIRMHLYPSQGECRDVAGAIVDMIYPAGHPSEIPVVAVTGTNGKTTTSRLIAACLRRKYAHVGMATSAGIYVDEQMVVSGDTTGPWSANVVLSDPLVEAAVLEVARGGIIRGGLGYDLADVAVITNISADHLGQDGVETLEDLARIKGLVTEAVRDNGYAVINATDPWCHRLGVESKRSIVFFSSESNDIIMQHLACGGKAVYILGNELVFAEGSNVIKQINIDDIPLTFRGIAKHNIENCSAAAAAAWALGMDLAEIELTLKHFRPDLKSNPGRQNLITVAGVNVMIDYGHNVAGINAVGTLAKRLCRGQVIGVICAPGDRTDVAIRSLGATASEFFDAVFIKEDEDLRGRRAGEVANLIKDGLLTGGMAEDKVVVALDEKSALQQGLSLSSAQDLLVVFYESLEHTLALLTELEQSLPASQTQMVVAGVVGR
ncbi:MAG: cyanophycin synthetase [Peptococcaceae bacterium]|nr:cyanophycin synthetase [Peptococcaceae bacterium]